MDIDIGPLTGWPLASRLFFRGLRNLLQNDFSEPHLPPTVLGRSCHTRGLGSLEGEGLGTSEQRSVLHMLLQHSLNSASLGLAGQLLMLGWIPLARSLHPFGLVFAPLLVHALCAGSELSKMLGRSSSRMRVVLSFPGGVR